MNLRQEVMDELKIADSYKDFDTDSYYAAYRTDPTSSDRNGPYITFLLDSLHDLFSAGYVTGQRLLDVGTGVSLLSFLSASLYVKEIHLSDFLPKHVELLQKWLDGVDIEQSIVQYVFEKEIKKDGRITQTKRLSDIRDKVKYIHQIDVNQHDLLGEPVNKYDVITSSFCLEAATKNLHEFKRALTNVSALLNAGGHLVLCGTLNEGHYVVGNYKFWNANISKGDLHSALESMCFTITFWREISLNETVDLDYTKAMTDFKTMFVLAAQKSHI